jgi:RND superfamily putative drug exporter
MAALARIVTGRRSKWLVVVFWLVLILPFGTLGGKLADATDNRTESFLPADAESTEALRVQEQRFPGGETVTGLIVYHRPGGLTDDDKAAIEADAERAAEAIPLQGPAVVPFAATSPPELVSPAGDLAYTIVAVPDDNDRLPQWGTDLRGAVHEETPGGLEVYVTGSLGFNADFEEVFGDIDVKVLLVTVVLVVVLLLLIYRSPVIALIPLVVVGIAYTIARGLVYLYAESGATVSDNGATILVVLMFGVGTDYCLLLVSRYREELRRHQDKHEAMALAIRRSGPAILASGLTVALTMLVLLVATIGSTNSLGPVAAIGVTVAFVAGLTLLPALLTITGRRGFWPRRHMVEFSPGGGTEEREGIWRRVGQRVLRRPGAALGVTLVLFGIGALGLLAYQEDYSVQNFFKNPTESADGFTVMQQAFPAGALVPTTVLVERLDGEVTDEDIAAVRDAAQGVDGVASIDAGDARSTDGGVARLTLIFDDDPFEAAALERVAILRDAVHGAAPDGVRVLVGDGTAVQADFNDAAARDLRLIVPLALLVIFVILAVLLQALVAPVLLIASVIVSFLGTLGLSVAFFIYVIGDTGVDNSLPTYAFIFLVALGIDYTIFLMSRVREEARHHGTREGTLRALAATGPVITSAGIILAGTFSVLLTLPVTFIFDLGFMVAVGILLDTFVVRTIMVPAIIELVGDRVWWPSTATGGGRALHEARDDTAVRV